MIHCVLTLQGEMQDSFSHLLDRVTVLKEKEGTGSSNHSKLTMKCIIMTFQ